MFEETNQNAFYTDRTFGRFKLVLVSLVADGTNWAIDPALTSPGISTVDGGSTIALSGLPKGQAYWFPGNPELVADTQVAHITAVDPAAGTLTIAAGVATNGVRIQWFFIVNRTG